MGDYVMVPAKFVRVLHDAIVRERAVAERKHAVFAGKSLPELCNLSAEMQAVRKEHDTAWCAVVCAERELVQAALDSPATLEEANEMEKLGPHYWDGARGQSPAAPGDPVTRAALLYLAAMDDHARALEVECDAVRRQRDAKAKRETAEHELRRVLPANECVLIGDRVVGVGGDTATWPWVSKRHEQADHRPKGGKPCTCS